MNKKAVIGAVSFIVVGIVTTIGSAYMLQNRDTTAPEDSLAARPIQTDRPEKTPRPTNTPKSEKDTVKKESGTTANGWKYSGFRDVKVDVVDNSTNDEAIIEFSREDFSDIESIYYNFTYYDNSKNIQRGEESTINPKSEAILESASGFVIRKRIYLGACSQGVCTPFTSLDNFELSVVTTRIGESREYEQLLSKETL